MSNTLILPCDAGDVSDGYHTFSDLYEHRCLLWVNLLQLNKASSFKTWKNDTGEEIDGWFIAGTNTSYGQITYYLPAKYWQLLSGVKEMDSNFDYDGHTSEDVLNRLEKLANAKNNRMRVSMNGLRRSLTIDANKLGESIKNLTPDSDYEVVKSFNSLAQDINILNCISDDIDETFSIMPETVKVYELLDQEE